MHWRPGVDRAAGSFTCCREYRRIGIGIGYMYTYSTEDARDWFLVSEFTRYR